jgi:flagellar hook-associated protein 2
MGAIGLNFGSPTSGTGFDVATMVASIKANMEGTETQYKSQLTSLQSEDASISNLGTLMGKLSTDMQDLTSATGVLFGLEGSSSNTSVLELATAGTGAVAGSHTIVVSQLAQTSSIYASALPSGDTLSGNISIQVGTGAAVVVPVNSNDTSLSGLASSINSAGVGVTASIIHGSAGDQLSLTSQTSGALGNISLTGSTLTDAATDTAVTFTTTESGQDAKMTVDGVAATSSGNAVSNVIPGLTFQLLSTSATPVQVQITNNTSSVATSVTTLVTDYNAVVSALNSQEGSTTTGSAEPLYGNPLIATIQGQLDTAISGSSSSDPTGIAALGLSLNNDGTLALNTDTLNTALTSNFNSVVSLFQSAGGVGQSLSTAVTNLGNTQPAGVLALAQTENASIEKNLNSTITSIDATIAAQTAALTASLNAANETLQLIPVQLQLVNEVYGAVSGYNKNNG